MPNPGPAADRHRLAAAVTGGLPQLAQPCASPCRGRRTPSCPCRATRSGQRTGCSASDLPGGHRQAEALELGRGQRHRLEPPTDPPVGGRVADDPVGLGVSLQAGRQVEGLTERQVGIVGVAHDDAAAGDADAAADDHPVLEAQLAHRRHQLQPGTHRLGGLVLLGLRPAEVGHHAVAEQRPHESAVAQDRLARGTVVGHQHGAQILGIHPLSQLRRAHQIAEEDGQQAAVRLLAAVARGQAGELAQQHLAVAQAGHAQLPEVGIGEVGGDGEVDPVGGERRGEPRHSEVSQERVDVAHGYGGGAFSRPMCQYRRWPARKAPAIVSKK